MNWPWPWSRRHRETEWTLKWMLVGRLYEMQQNEAELKAMLDYHEALVKRLRSDMEKMRARFGLIEEPPEGLLPDELLLPSPIRSSTPDGREVDWEDGT